MRIVTAVLGILQKGASKL